MNKRQTEVKEENDNDSYIQDMLDSISLYAEDHPEFDTDFVDSVQEAFDTYGKLTPKQLDALENICEKFHIEV